MSIRIDGERLFSLETEHTLYQMKAEDTGLLLHVWYGRKTGADMSYLIRTVDRGFSGNPFEKIQIRARPESCCLFDGAVGEKAQHDFL